MNFELIARLLRVPFDHETLREHQRRSMLTGEPDKVTVQMVAPRQLTSGDVMFAVGKLGRAAGFEPMVGKIAIAKDPTTAVFDMATDAADELVKFSKEQNLESIEFTMCPVLPLLQEVPVSLFIILVYFTKAF